MAGLRLASRSPRRRELLRDAGIAFEPGPYPGLDEAPFHGLPPQDAVVVLATAKAQAATPLVRGTDDMVLAADTLVALESPAGYGQALGQPEDAADARAMLARLSDRWHAVHSGVALAARDPAGTWCLQVRAATTRVRFRELSSEEIEAYVATGEPLDKAGAYGIQGRAAAFVAQVDGTVDTVVGLPIAVVRALLAWGRAVVGGGGAAASSADR